jgi:2-amino-4-hydroxy-6-hydroxymethyldihydropteridine diphosphokinase
LTATLAPLDAVIGLGSNLGDRRENLCAAVTSLCQLGHLVALSSLYETVPMGGPPQPSFLNAAVRIATRLGPGDLLESLHAVETSRGRVRRERWGPRTLDLDLLWVRGLRLVGSNLTVPHPRLAERAFAMIPLVEVAPDAADPVDGVRYADRLARVDQGGVIRVGSFEQAEVQALQAPGLGSRLASREAC